MRTVTWLPVLKLLVMTFLIPAASQTERIADVLRSKGWVSREECLGMFPVLNGWRQGSMICENWGGISKANGRTAITSTRSSALRPTERCATVEALEHTDTDCGSLRKLSRNCPYEDYCDSSDCICLRATSQRHIHTMKRKRFKAWLLLIDGEPIKIYPNDPRRDVGAKDYTMWRRTVSAIHGKYAKIIECSVS